MVQTASIVLAITAVLSGLFRAFIKPRVDELGLFRKVPNFNNQNCKPINGLEACEDIYIHRPSGLAYLACSHAADRAHWTPALSLLNRERMHRPSLDYVAVLDLETYDHRHIKLLNLPTHLQINGLHAHGIDLYVGEKLMNQDFIENDSANDKSTHQRVTLYLINHNSPKPNVDDGDSTQARSLGADSVIEVFETSVGHSEAVHRMTIRHPLILTPNNLVATSHNSFYVSNDHSVKTGLNRKFEPWVLDRDVNSIVHCSFTDESETPTCIVAAEGYPHPNGIAKGPGSSIYLATTINPHLFVYETQADHTLVLTDELKLPRMTDNIYVTDSGSVYLATIPKALSFVRAVNDPSKLKSPTEVWRISNETGHDAFFGGRLAVEKILGDDGEIVSGTTGVGVYGTKIFLTGVSSPYVSVCEMGEEKWTK